MIMLPAVCKKLPPPVKFKVAVLAADDVGAMPIVVVPVTVSVLPDGIASELAVVELLETESVPNVLLSPKLKTLLPVFSDPNTKLLAAVPLTAKPTDCAAPLAALTVSGPVSATALPLKLNPPAPVANVNPASDRELMLLFDVNWLLVESKLTISPLAGTGLPPVQLPVVFQLVSVAPVHVSVAACTPIAANRLAVTIEIVNVARTKVARSMFDLLAPNRSMMIVKVPLSTLDEACFAQLLNGARQERLTTPR